MQLDQARRESRAAASSPFRGMTLASPAISPSAIAIQPFSTTLSRRTRRAFWIRNSVASIIDLRLLPQSG